MSDFLNDWICFEIRLDRKREEPDLGIGEVDELCDCVLFHCREDEFLLKGENFYEILRIRKRENKGIVWSDYFTIPRLHL